MILVVYSYKVPQEQFKEYLEVTQKQISPFWEERGCKYEVYQHMDDSSSFLKLMCFEDEKTFRENFLEKDKEVSKEVAFQ